MADKYYLKLARELLCRAHDVAIKAEEYESEAGLEFVKRRRMSRIIRNIRIEIDRIGADIDHENMYGRQ